MSISGYIRHEERWVLHQRPLDGRCTVGNFKHGTSVREVLVEQLPGKTALGRIASGEQNTYKASSERMMHEVGN